MKYMSILQTPECWGISTWRIQISCCAGRITEAIWVDYAWAIFDDEPKAKNARIKSEKYIKGDISKKDLF